jgi:Domain of unknown function (DUF4411)
MHLLDANVLISANANFYPLDRIPQFWDWLIAMGGVGHVKIPVEQAAALTGLAPVAYDRGTPCGKQTITGAHCAPRYVMIQAALVAAHHNPRLTSFAGRRHKAGKPHNDIRPPLPESSSPLQTDHAKTVRNVSPRPST